MSSDEGADWGVDEDCWECTVDPGPVEEIRSQKEQIPLFPREGSRHYDGWHSNELTHLYRAFWDPYKSCDLLPFVPQQVEEQAEEAAPLEGDDMQGPLECGYEHLERGHLAASTPFSDSNVATPPVIGSHCPLSPQLVFLAKFILDNIIQDEEFRQADVVLVLTDSNPLQMYPRWISTSTHLQF